MRKGEVVSINGLHEIVDTYIDDFGIGRYGVMVKGSVVYFMEDEIVKAPEPKDLMGGKLGDLEEMRSEE